MRAVLTAKDIDNVPFGHGRDNTALKGDKVRCIRDEIAAVQIAEPMEDYIVALVAETRRPAEFSEDLARYIQVGVSPRGSLALDKVSRAHAWLQGRDQVTPDDIRAVINDCLRHRIIPSFEAQADGVTNDELIQQGVEHAAEFDGDVATAGDENALRPLASRCAVDRGGFFSGDRCPDRSALPARHGFGHELRVQRGTLLQCLRLVEWHAGILGCLGAALGARFVCRGCHGNTQQRASGQEPP